MQRQADANSELEKAAKVFGQADQTTPAPAQPTQPLRRQPPAAISATTNGSSHDFVQDGDYEKP